MTPFPHSGYIPKAGHCVGCGKCEQECPVHAISETKRKQFTLDSELCLGCGICAHSCPTKTIQMVKRKKNVSVPDSKLELQLLRALERGKLADFVCEGGSSWGYPFLKFLSKFIVFLPYRVQMKAITQLSSIYFKNISTDRSRILLEKESRRRT